MRQPVRTAALLAALILALATPSSAQESTLRGTVRDAESGEPLPGANVRLSHDGDTAPRGTATDTEGRFEFLRLAAGPWHIEVTFVGYEAYRAALDDLSPLEINLRPAGFEINPITITASRRAERVLDAPASVAVLDARQLSSRTALTAAEHLKDAPSVDLATTGLVSSRIVIRGFNDNLASSLLTLVDHRIAAAPAFRLTALQLIPMSGADIDRIEVLSGPASALYGPNAANGVVHVFSKSPFDAQGTQVSLAGGEQSVMLGSFNTAGVYQRRLGYKFSAQYYSGRDFEFFSPAELSARAEALAAGASADTLLVGRRDFDVENLSLNGRLDFRFSEHGTVIVQGGRTTGSNIEITPTGAAQVNGAGMAYLQTKVLYKNLFVQGYVNALRSGDSFFLRTGDPFLDKSRMYVVQAQHFKALGERQRFTYGIDYFYTLPDGEGSVSGQHEDDDVTTEVGAYVQSDTDLSRRFSVTAAARLDRHDRLERVTFSPRAALVYKPRAGHTVRLTYNRAFRTPKTNDLFADLVGLRDVFTLGRMEPLVGFAPTTDLRVQGMLTGFHFGAIPQVYSPFAPVAGLGRDHAFALGDPTLTAIMWDVARAASVAGLADNLASSGLLDPSNAAAVGAALDRVLPHQVQGVAQTLKRLDLVRQEFVPVAAPQDYDKLRVTRSESVEIGWKGLLLGGLIVGVDAYWNRVRDFMGPFEVGTPNVFLDAYTLNGALTTAVRAALADPANSQAAADLAPLDRIPFLGNNNGSAAEEVASLLATGVAGSIPFGTVTPREAFDPVGIILMRRNFGDISVYGVDAAFTLFLSRHFRIGGTYAWVSDNYFENVDGIDDISLNAPRHKFGGLVQWETPDERFGAQVRWRFIDAYPVRSDVYVGHVERFGVVDASVSWRLPMRRDTRLNLTVQNLTDNEHREFVDVAEIGRLAMLRVTHSL